MAVGEIGIDRFMFGTDYPYIVSDPSYIEALDLTHADKSAIFGDNAVRLLGHRLDL
jgi:aminocarboxymuconate-semialdehyde decarboxylase